MIDVSTYSTAGDGSAANPFVGWDTACPWAPDTEFFFPKVLSGGYYAYTTSPNFLKTGIALRGEAGTVLRHLGAGNAVTFDNPGTAPLSYDRWTMNVRMENFIIQGNPLSTNGLFLRGVRNGIFRHIGVRDVTNAGLWAEACVTNIVDNFRCTLYECAGYVFAVRPKYGIVIAARGPDTSTTFVFTNPVIEGVGVVADNSGIGIWIQTGSYAHKFIGGTCETIFGKGAKIDSWLNCFEGMDFEGNQGAVDVDINGSYNELRGVACLSGQVKVNLGQMNKLRGKFVNISIANPVDFCDISGAYLSGALTDVSGGNRTVKFGYQTGAGFQDVAKLGKVGLSP
jgi:hypothetical protein